MTKLYNFTIIFLSFTIYLFFLYLFLFFWKKEEENTVILRLFH